ncbi:enoyl-[acyl-carrier-protein] reductase [Desulfocucumis palustris]|uniref:Probable nitronate monooxygenase n=1 Tax=Desulfocucumis palustris TaxID=1898651 RepID=A0A2L2X784_9FIRM|nr:nitronate monooxygenase [Desulfocucumis palustris]GBF31850.1 enoyl-[acyl-carrier-protein] reductase [Desulfocucumis palustris]
MEIPQLKIGDLMPRFPIIQGGMALRVSTASLAAAVAEAGGIGVIGATGMTPEEMRMEIREAKKLSRGIVGVNIMFAVREFAQLVKAAIDEKIDVIFTGAGFSRDIFNWGREAGVPVVSIVSSARLAKIAERYGAAAVVAEGNEAGGHLGTDQSLFDILPSIRSAIKIPLIAAGGLVDGGGIARTFKLGADGVQMATRFVLSQECSVADAFKQMYLRATADDVVVIPSPVGMPGRALKNSFVNNVLNGLVEKAKNCTACLKACTGQYCIINALEKSRIGKVQEGVVFAGKNVHMIKDILPVKDIFNKLLREIKEYRD